MSVFVCSSVTASLGILYLLISSPNSFLDRIDLVSAEMVTTGEDDPEE